MKAIPLAAVLVLIAGCAQTATEGSGSGSATAVLRDASGGQKARATVTESGAGLRVRIEAAGMAPGKYGAHIHAVGRCDGPDFASAGPHWNPAGRQHGRDNPQGMHMGDLPNLEVAADGRGDVEYLVAGASLRGSATSLLDDDGAAIVVHAKADDYRTDPSGNSGPRMACGILG